LLHAHPLPTVHRPGPLDPRAWSAIAAAAGPSLLAYNVSPSPTFLNQALALGLWGAFMLACAPRSAGRAPAVLWLALGLVGIGVLWSWGPGALPSTFAWSALGLLAAAATLVAAGAAARREEDAETIFSAFATGWVITGLFNFAIACIQVFAPDVADGNWISSSGIPGRAVGNLRQPNHLSSLLLWSSIATVALLEMGHLGRRLAAGALALFVFGVVLTGSRTGIVSVLLLAAWGLVDRRLAKPARLLLLATPLLYALAWLAMARWAELAQGTFGAAQRFAGGDISSSRFAIWSNTLALMRSEPWLGVGFGEFNLAWSLTPFPGRPTAFFDHTHNLPLQLMVELGLPLALAILALALAALWRAGASAWGPAGGIGSRAALLMIVMIGLHSLLEYPLWYSYFLLPAAWAWGYALGGPRFDAKASAKPSLALTLGAAAVVAGAALAVIDYMRVAVIFRAGEGLGPLEQRIEAGRRSVLFAHHADYAAVTSSVQVRDPGAAYARTTHYLLDTRLMMSWARWLAAQGHVDLARHLAARLREFHKQEVEEFFEACPDRPVEDSAAPFQCQAPQRVPDWREFLSVPGR
jgi:hypothetical protein